MGGMISSQMEGVMQKNMDAMKEQQQQMLERNIQMQNYMRERQMAMQLAKGREMFTWLGSFYTLAVVAMFAGYKKSGSRAALAPFLPLTFVVGYQADLAYGTKMNRIRDQADKILESEMGMLSLPGGGLPTLETLDGLRDKKYKADGN